MDNNQINNSMDKYIELSMEREYLDFIIDKVRKETGIYLDKRKDIVKDIVEYRKEFLEEDKNDEDKVAEYFDHERYLKEKLYGFTDKKLKELTILEQNPYFGKVNFIDEGDEDSIYIGRYGFLETGNYKPFIVDWRAPICQIFYQGKLGNIAYESPDGKIEVDVKSKRQYVIRKGILKGMFDSALDVKDEVLQMILSENTKEKLKDIVMTIQEEQDNLIRQPKDKAMIVNGVAGSGKTTIALHRVAYLLYNYRNQIQDKVLILGPNNIFVDYISEVLPSLGENGVKQTTFKDFIEDLIPTNNFLEYDNYIERFIKKDNEFIEDIAYKQSKAYMEDLDSFMEDLEQNIFITEDVILMEEVAIDKKEIDEMLHSYYKYMPLFKRSRKIKRIVFSKIRDVRNKKVYEIQRQYEEKLKKLSEEELQLNKNNLEFERKNNIRNIVRKSMELKKSLVWLDNPQVLDIYNEFNNNNKLTVDDIIAILYLKIKLEGLRYRNEIKYIVIDEAQDYSFLQFVVLKELTDCQSITIVGDVNQRTLPCKDEVPMLCLDSVFNRVDVEYFNLDKSYRSTKEIIEYANKHLKTNKIVPLVREGDPVKEVTVKNSREAIDKVNYYLSYLENKEYENIAIITTTLEQGKVIGSELKKQMYINLIEREDIIYSGGKIIIPSYLSKGLEFDATILILDDNNIGENLKYIMATRALHEMIVVHKEGKKL
ncbi:TPA: AAA family ATPase [Clostridium botulinum]|uniref:HelD family protein n=1 Tax=Clostridium botulinum TaxID=1491 RepID=UPI00099D08CC|nr:UvrD-helicase domain-containing protein [Clostridium botulinum]NFA98154.1 ATP-dependent DNA helicase [Clostridium botulinum]NFB52678.1 ATP-dependent DNA helicase [Clostridium botulinum]NFC77111.1 ATP-dependent DNA helicase [Clostridium botulinum]NFC86929.1 ATP-dependent DNA helicase [Clostridium botulinum]NFD06574.1 ATP-dependent DNA helicase [Clostridium botulinum]